MDVSIKRFDVEMLLKTNGMELDIKQPNGGEHIGDVVISKTGVTWCRGRTTPAHGISKSWDELIALMEEPQATSSKKKNNRSLSSENIAKLIENTPNEPDKI
ncbi:MAG TPA: hypothetical protein VHO71_04905 [Caproiciproducens sp.]|nr:hypothetical protein [Caproiciproducens sp.]